MVACCSNGVLHPTKKPGIDRRDYSALVSGEVLDASRSLFCFGLEGEQFRLGVIAGHFIYLPLPLSARGERKGPKRTVEWGRGRILGGMEPRYWTGSSRRQSKAQSNGAWESWGTAM